MHLAPEVLPMGWTRASYFAQRRHAAALGLCKFIASDGVLEDATAVPELSDKSCVALPYCDNLAVGSLSASLCEDAQRDIIQSGGALGFRIHKIEAPSTRVDSLGLSIDGKEGH